MRRSLSLLATAALFGALGCDLVDSAKARIVVGGFLAATPEIKLTGYLDRKGETVASVYLGERASETSTEEPDPVLGADVRVTFAGNSVKLTEQPGGDGLYLTSSIDDMALIYAEGQTYSFAASIPGDDTGEHGGAVKAPTRLTAAAVTFEPALTPFPTLADVQKHPKATALTVSWLPQNGRYAYVTVFRADAMKPTEPTQVFDSSPRTAGEMIKFIVGTPPTSITIPADTFSTDGAYAVLLVTADKGDPKTNTFLGSPLLAGSGVAFVLAVGDFMP